MSKKIFFASSTTQKVTHKLTGFLIKPRNIPKLVPLSSLNSNEIKKYKALQNDAKTVQFREKILTMLGESSEDFLTLSQSLSKEGALAFRDFVTEKSFGYLVNAYDDALSKMKSSPAGHTFKNFQYMKNFLVNAQFNDALFHPLLILLIAYQLGTPIRLIDIRGKDAKPMKTTVRDNGVHLDDTLFGKEFKIILMWQKGTTKGPNGQNMVLISRAHHLVRQIDTEHGANFDTAEEIANEILFNKYLDKSPYPVEMSDERPMTVIFDATRVPHHRYRNTSNNAMRSCLILAFHPITENNFPSKSVELDNTALNKIQESVFGQFNELSSTNVTEDFLRAIKNYRLKIKVKIQQLIQSKKLVPLKSKTLSREKFTLWLKNIEEGYKQSQFHSIQFSTESMNVNRFQNALMHSIEFDRHCDLDLRLYPDRREVKRKELRNRLREQGVNGYSTKALIEHRVLGITKLTINDILSPNTLTEQIKTVSTDHRIDECSRLLLNDLLEALNRCHDIQTFRSTSLFVYLLLEELANTTHFLQLNTHILSLFKHYAALVWADDFYIRKNTNKTPAMNLEPIINKYFDGS
ncbi:hypothetical protein [uncultured Shewanella sp.]|uniref:hypothetical protein n=1 Tax=uncultured Shewanella sp. TaxID=173975 RepID=UPI00260E2A8A|nr:hypothetical protein [uncultured Shewanella sp.]